MGALITAIVAVGFTGIATVMWFDRAKRVAIPDDRTLFLSMWLLGAVIGVMALAQQPGFFSGSLAVLAILGGAGILVLNYLAPQKADSPIEVGQPIPAFTAIDENGDTFDSISLNGSKVLLKFFRGHW